MTNRGVLIISSAILALVVLIFLWSRPKAVTLPSTISTVAAGYSFALQIKNRMAQDAYLTTVLVELDRQRDRFQVQKITYGFATSRGKPRIFAVAVDNVTHHACAAMDCRNLPENPYRPAAALQPLDLSTVAKEISEVLEIAKSNGLGEFCSLVPATTEQVDLSLGNSDTGPVWSIAGDAWDDRGPIAELHIMFDARTGSVLNRTLQKAANRP